MSSTYNLRSRQVPRQVPRSSVRKRTNNEINSPPVEASRKRTPVEAVIAAPALPPVEAVAIAPDLSLFWRLNERALNDKYTNRDVIVTKLWKFVCAQVVLGLVPIEKVANLFAMTLRNLPGESKKTLISVELACQLKKLIPIVSSYYNALLKALVLVIFDTWNLHELDVPDHYLCYMGNFGKGPLIRDGDTLESIAPLLENHTKNRENNVLVDFSFVAD